MENNNTTKKKENAGRNDYKNQWRREKKEEINVSFDKEKHVRLNLKNAAESRGLSVQALARIYILDGLNKDGYGVE